MRLNELNQLKYHEILSRIAQVNHCKQELVKKARLHEISNTSTNLPPITSVCIQGWSVGYLHC